MEPIVLKSLQQQPIIQRIRVWRRLLHRKKLMRPPHFSKTSFFSKKTKNIYVIKKLFLEREGEKEELQKLRFA